MIMTLDGAARMLLGAILQSVGGTALYPDALDPMGDNIGGDEFAVNPYQRRALPPITDADIVAHLTQGPYQPRPTLTAWEGSTMSNAYWLDNGVWRSCADGSVWEWKE